MYDQCEFWVLQPGDGTCYLMSNKGNYNYEGGYSSGDKDPSCMNLHLPKIVNAVDEKQDT